jgi:hypothetical protein
MGAPDTEQYFSNENAGSPLSLSSAGVFLSLSVGVAPCRPLLSSFRVDGQATLTVGGQKVARTIGYIAPLNSESGWGIAASLAHGGDCYAFNFITTTQTARDANLNIADQMITSFQVT